MATLNAGLKTTVSVPIGSALRVAAAAGVSGSITRLANPQGGEPYSPVAYSGAALDFGGYDVVTLWRIESVVGAVPYDIVNKAYAAPLRYNVSVAAGRKSTLYVPANTEVIISTKTTPHSGSIIPLANPTSGEPGAPIPYTGNKIILGPFPGVRLFRLESYVGTMDASTNWFDGSPMVAARAGRPLLIGTVGNSREYNGMLRSVNAVEGVSNYLTILGLQNWAQSNLKGRAIFPASMQFAVSGYTTQQMVDNKLAAAVASGADVIILWPGTNEATGGTLGVGGVTRANVTRMINELTAAGIVVVLITESPRGNSTYPAYQLSSTNAAAWTAYHDWLETLVNPKLVKVNIWDEQLLPGSTLAEILVANSDDGLHPNVVQAKNTLGPRVFAAIDRILPSTGFVFPVNNNSLFNASTNPGGNLIANGAMLGVGGTPKTPLTGNLADSWTVSASGGWSGGTGMSAVGSKIAKADGSEWQQIVFGGVIGGTTGIFDIRTALTVGNFTAGDKVRGCAIIEVDEGFTGLREITNYLTMQTNAGANLFESKMPHSTTGYNLPADRYVGDNALYCITPEIVVGALALNSASFRIAMLPIINTTLAATIRIGNAGVFKMPA